MEKMERLSVDVMATHHCECSLFVCFVEELFVCFIFISLHYVLMNVSKTKYLPIYFITIKRIYLLIENGFSHNSV